MARAAPAPTTRLTSLFVALAALASLLPSSLAYAQAPLPNPTTTRARPPLLQDIVVVRQYPANPRANPRPADPCARLTKEWAEHLRADFQVQGAASLTCPSLESRFAQGASDLRAISFAGSGHDFYREVTTAISGTAVGGYFTEIIQRPGRKPRRRENRNFVAYYDTDSREMSIFVPFEAQDDAQISFTLYHEAAHGFDGQPGHVDCLFEGARKGNNSCDAVFYGDYRGGAFNHEFMYLVALKERSTANALLKSIAAGVARDFLTSRFRRITPRQIEAWEKRLGFATP